MVKLDRASAKVESPVSVEKSDLLLAISSEFLNKTRTFARGMSLRMA
jgi:hypothetical protein